MTGNTLEQRARVLLAAEFRRELWHSDAAEVMAGEGDQIYGPALRAIEAALRLSAGADWVLVPREPTEAMRDAFRGVIDNPHAQWHTWPDRFRAAYRAMLDAAPRHETGEG